MKQNYIKESIQDLHKHACPKDAKFLQGFFKTGKGQYGEGDVFIGVRVPQTRAVAKKYLHLDLKDLQSIITSKIHEERLLALIILVEKFKKADEKTQKLIYEFYLSNTAYINNWDLVDLTAGYIVGHHLLNKPKAVLFKMAKSKLLWDRRIAIISTHGFIRNKLFDPTFEISERLLTDKEDLIHKASGWMLREVGKKDELLLEEEFLKKHYKIMPRTMLRYAIERFEESKRKFYLDKII